MYIYKYIRGCIIYIIEFLSLLLQQLLTPHVHPLSLFSGAAITEQLTCRKCGSKCRNCNTNVERRRPSPRNQEPWNREPPMAACAICDEVSCSTCRQQARCSNCLNDYCASCSSMKICSECDRKFCTDCTRSEFLFLLCFWCYYYVVVQV